MFVIKRKYYGYLNLMYCDISNLYFFYLMIKKLFWGMDKFVMFYFIDKYGEIVDFMKRCIVIVLIFIRKILVGLLCI